MRLWKSSSQFANPFVVVDGSTSELEATLTE